MFEIELQAETHRQQLMIEAAQYRLMESDSNAALSLRLPLKRVALFGQQWWSKRFGKAVTTPERKCVECGVPA
jgi:hypothetical protein